MMRWPISVVMAVGSVLCGTPRTVTRARTSGVLCGTLHSYRMLCCNTTVRVYHPGAKVVVLFDNDVLCFVATAVVCAGGWRCCRSCGHLAASFISLALCDRRCLLVALPLLSVGGRLGARTENGERRLHGVVHLCFERRLPLIRLKTAGDDPVVRCPCLCASLWMMTTKMRKFSRCRLTPRAIDTTARCGGGTANPAVLV